MYHDHALQGTKSNSLYWCRPESWPFSASTGSSILTYSRLMISTTDTRRGIRAIDGCILSGLLSVGDADSGGAFCSRATGFGEAGRVCSVSGRSGFSYRLHRTVSNSRTHLCGVTHFKVFQGEVHPCVHLSVRCYTNLMCIELV